MARAVVIPPPPPGDELGDASDSQLWNAQVLLSMVCNRGHATERTPRREFFCYLGRVLKVEADLRGLPSPPEHPTTADLKRV